MCAADAFCKDKVNTVKKVNVEGSATVTFLGAGGQSISVDCPKVLCSSFEALLSLLCPAPAWPKTCCWALQDSYILDAGLDAGVELPYTCRGGICG